MAMALVTTTSGKGRHGTTDKSPYTSGNVTVEINPEATFDVPRLSPVSDQCPKIKTAEKEVEIIRKSCSIRQVWNSAYLQMISGVFLLDLLVVLVFFFCFSAPRKNNYTCKQLD